MKNISKHQGNILLPVLLFAFCVYVGFNAIFLGLDIKKHSNEFEAYQIAGNVIISDAFLFQGLNRKKCIEADILTTQTPAIYGSELVEKQFALFGCEQLDIMNSDNSNNKLEKYAKENNTTVSEIKKEIGTKISTYVKNASNHYFNWEYRNINGRDYLLTHQFKDDNSKADFIKKINLIDSPDNVDESSNEYVYIPNIDMACAFFNAYNKTLSDGSDIMTVKDTFSRMYEQGELLTEAKNINTDSPFGCYKDKDDIYIYVNI